MAETNHRSIITDKLVIAKTGATMEEWFRHLDSLGAQKLKAAGIWKLIQTVDGLEPLGEWNQGLLSTSYQWSRGLRERGKKKDGFEVSVSKMIHRPVSVVYQAFVDAKLRREWLSERLEITKQTENKSARAIWPGGTRLSVDFYSKGDGKAQIVVQHLKLPDGETASKMKIFWGERLNKLKNILES